MPAMTAGLMQLARSVCAGVARTPATPGMSVAVPTHPDDDAGRAPGRRAAHARDGNRVGNSPAARLCDFRRFIYLPAADAFHPPRRLYLHGSHQWLAQQPIALAILLRHTSNGRHG